MQVVQWSQLSREQQKQALVRPPLSQSTECLEKVKSIIEHTRQDGDQALLALTQQFDGVSLNALSVDCRFTAVDEAAHRALETAIGTIRDYHSAMKPQTIQVDTAPGVRLTKVYQPIQRVGLYVPGGDTPLISSLLMLAIPADIAGNPVKVLCTPPNRHGLVDPLLQMAARMCKIERIHPIGGAQAIAAMAYGTQSIPKVDKIFGPGNRYVTAAKTWVAQDPDAATIDMPAGPSEVMILADASANPEFIAADLLSQAEHGVDSQVMLVTTSEALMHRVFECLQRQQAVLARRDIIRQSLVNSRVIVCTTKQQMVDVANAYAAEHLIINLHNPESLVEDIQAAGSIFVGPWAAESMGDYLSGSNHVLPTYGYARSISGLSTGDFMNAVCVQRISPLGIVTLGEAAKTLALREGLTAHANAISVRENALCG